MLSSDLNPIVNQRIDLYFLVIFLLLTTLSASGQSLTKEDTLKAKANQFSLSKPAVSVETVKADQLPTVPSFSLDQALVGKVAGAMFSSVSGTPGAPVNIQLRGINTLINGTLPLILVDGVQLGETRMNALDPSLVERVEIIQGAAAAAIFGYQGANGVISIVTKRGQKGKLKIDISSSISQNTVINQGNLQKSRLHNYKTDSNGNLIDINGNIITLNPNNLTLSGNLSTTIGPNSIFSKMYQGNFHFNDHFADFFNQAKSATNRISLSGGGQKTDVLFSISNNRMDNNFAHDGYNNRTNLALNMGVALTSRLTLRSTTQYALTENTVNYFDQAAIVSMLETKPFVNYSIKDTDGNYGYIYNTGAGSGTSSNPNYVMQYSNRNSNLTDLVQSFHAIYRLSNILSVDARYGINTSHSSEKVNIADQSQNKNVIQTHEYLAIYNGFNKKGESLNTQRNYLTEHSVLNATAIIDFKKDLNLSVPIKSTSWARSEWRKMDDNLSTTTMPSYLYSFTGREWLKTNSLLFHQTFEFNNWLGISGALRKDYSSITHLELKAFRQGTIQADFSQMGFWHSSNVLNKISQFKLRGAVGKAGVQPISFLDTYGTEFISQPPETSTESEAGLDIAINRPERRWFRNSGISITEWQRNTPNSEYPYSLSPGTGYYGTYGASFALSSKGVQFSFSSTIYSSSRFQWDITTFFGHQVSCIDANRSGTLYIAGSIGELQPRVGFQVGEGIGQIRGVRLLTRIDQKDENGNYYIPLAQQANYVIASNGYVVDAVNKTPIATNNEYPLGDSAPKFNSSFINEIKLLNLFTVSFQLDWIYKSHLYNMVKELMYFGGFHNDFNKPFTVNQSTGAWSAFYYGVPAYGYSDYFYEDASFLRLRNVSFKFDLVRLMKLSHWRKMQLELSGRNLLTITKYSGMDPEVNSGNIQSSWNHGIDNGTLPNLRSYQIGLNLGL